MHRVILAIVTLLAVLLAGCATGKPPTAFSEAIQYRDQGDMTEYRRALERELKTNPGNLDARYDLALDLEQNGHANDARKLYEQNLQQKWHFASAINLANLLHQQGKIAKTEDILDKTEQQYPHEATPLYLLGDLAVEQKQKQEADRYYQQAIAADPSNGFAHLHYATFLIAQNKAEEARHQASEAVDRQPDCAACWQTYGDILKLSGQAGKAVDAYQRALALEPDTATRLKLIGALQSINESVRAQHMQEALQALKSSSTSP